MVIGVNDYGDPSIEDLEYCVADAKLVAETLRKKCGYPESGLLLITDSKNLEEQARRLLAVEAINATITHARSDERAARLGLAQREPLPEPPPPTPPSKKTKKGKKK